jgi:hypothetical protein
LESYSVVEDYEFEAGITAAINTNPAPEEETVLFAVSSAWSVTIFPCVVLIELSYTVRVIEILSRALGIA